MGVPLTASTATDHETTYQWQRRSRTPGGPRTWQDIRGASGETYTPRARDLRHRLRVVATTTAPGHQPHVATTRSSRRVAEGLLPRPARRLTVRGSRDLGDVVRIARLGRYRAQLPDGTRLRIAWYAGADRLRGAHRPRLTIGRAAVGERLRATITVRAPGYRTRTLSTPRTGP